MAKVNYVCPCWSGPRRGGDELYNQDRGLYLKAQIHQLMMMKHSLDQITIVLPHNPEVPPAFANALGMLPSKIQGTPVVIMETPNTLSSYGPYGWAYEKYSDFDYYILIEDDYVFVQHKFDNILQSLIDADKTCGYLCSKVSRCEDGSPIASVSNGIVAAWAFGQIWSRYGKIPHAGQADFSDAFKHTGIKMKDYGGKYRSPFYGFGTCAWFYPNNHKDLIVPVQVFLNQSKFRQVFLPSSWPEWLPLTLPVHTFMDNNEFRKQVLENTHAQ